MLSTKVKTIKELIDFKFAISYLYTMIFIYDIFKLIKGGLSIPIIDFALFIYIIFIIFFNIFKINTTNLNITIIYISTLWFIYRVLSLFVG